MVLGVMFSTSPLPLLRMNAAVRIPFMGEAFFILGRI